MVGLGHAFFFLLDAWADLAQEESYQVVATVFHYLKVGDLKKKSKKASFPPPSFVLLFFKIWSLNAFFTKGFLCRFAPP